MNYFIKNDEFDLFVFPNLPVASLVMKKLHNKAVTKIFIVLSDRNWFTEVSN